ncbi:MAG: hypothetical protein ABIK09_03160 [Pseudomonadota bacterium]
MGLATGALLIVLGILAASGFIIKKRPEAKELIAKLATYQGWIGFVCCIWGVWTIINSVLNLGWLKEFPIWWITYLASGVVQAGLGFILGYGLLQTYALAKAPAEARAKAEQFYQKLVAVQIPFGLIGIGVGVWCIIAQFMFLG